VLQTRKCSPINIWGKRRGFNKGSIDAAGGKENHDGGTVHREQGEKKPFPLGRRKREKTTGEATSSITGEVKKERGEGELRGKGKPFSPDVTS